MRLTLIICTYMRVRSLETLMNSVALQEVYPDEIIIVDGSTDKQTESRFRESEFKNIKYYLVPENQRGLTKQRNYGIERVASATDVVCFLDDDTILDTQYFKKILDTYIQYPEALGVGGYINNEIQWEKAKSEATSNKEYFYYDGYRRKESSRYKLRKRLGLVQQLPPGWYPKFGHGRSIGFLPPSGKIYQTELLMGGVSSFPKAVLDTHKFSEYFEGYGLYEDAEYTLRLSKLGKLYVNTNATLEHHHDPDGRPNQFNYGKMVVRNGWYVWRVKHQKPALKNRVKWYLITILLIIIRLSNVITTQKRKEALTESLGRIVGILSLIFYLQKKRT